MKEMTLDGLVETYCQRMGASPDTIFERLHSQKQRYPDLEGWLLWENQVMDSSRFCDFGITCYGPSNTYRDPIGAQKLGPVPLHGVGSSMSVVVGFAPRSKVHP